ncbi:family 20 glycosylhydrolase [Auraticoccus monumenti]|uniref:beta-N-acetylhexosaminidase n=1 Tax=Auraticoccus monumenti TaxID=675864 RepID=A0A1G6TZR2_9ACTN|nr:family 20 glycosylhydrolase [Auraticoccus monumenti]SDD34563.1 N-acetyl-beta-hexosaminidase [Auraticoccus monumenti]
MPPRAPGPTRPRTVAALLLALTLLAVLLPAGRAAAEPPPPTVGRDVALTGTASAATVYTGDPARFAAEHVNDGDLGTRWGSDYAREGVVDPPASSHDPSRDWVQVELAEPSPVDHVVVYWENAHAAEYELQVSDDGQQWETVVDVDDGRGGREVLQVGRSEPVSFVRVQGVRLATGWGYSIWSLEVWDAPPPGAGEEGRVLPAPVSLVPGEGEPFELGTSTRVVAAGEGALAVARLLAEELRPATGLALPVTRDGARAGDVLLELDESAATGDAAAEGYTLQVSADGVAIRAATAHGLFNGTQSLRQLLPASVYGDVLRPGPWTVEPVSITDHPRYPHRGLMIDPARNFVEVDEVKTIIDDLVASKGNVLHIHLTDDQGWRLEIDSWPRLTEVGGAMSMPGGRTGFYTQEQFADIVAYAAERFVQVVPEIDMPAHATAAIAAYPELTCGGGVLCPTSETTYRFIDDVLGEVAALSPSEYLHIGADEAPMAHDDYVDFVRRAESIVQAHGKTMIGWSPAPGVGLDPSTVHHYWQDQSREMNRSWFEPRRPVIVSPTQQLYLDYPYPRHGTRMSYDWDPEDLVDSWTGERPEAYGFQPADVIGLEAPIWGERMTGGLPDIQQQVFPRLPAILEKAWSPAEATQDVTPLLARMGHQGARWMFAGTRFWVDPEVDWAGEAAGRVLTLDRTRSVAGVVADVAVPGADPGTLSATIEWGDGTESEAEVVAPASGRESDLLTVRAEHTYPRLDTWGGTVHVRGPRGLDLSAPFTARTVPLLATVGSASEHVTDGTARVEIELFNSTSQPIRAVVTAQAPEGVEVSPARRPVAVASGRTQTVRFDVTSAAPPGELELVFGVQVTSGRQQVDLPDLTVTMQQPYRDLASAFDAHAVTDDADPGPAWLGGGVDGDGSSLSLQALAAQGVRPGEPLVREGFELRWPDGLGAPDHVRAAGQRVEVQGRGEELGFLLTGAYAPVSGTGTVVYTDGTEQDFRLVTPDWHQPASGGSSLAVGTGYNNFRDGSRVERPANVFLQRVPLDPGKTVAQVVLPRSEQGGPFFHRIFDIAVR